jgi:hypothetical protein
MAEEKHIKELFQIPQKEFEHHLSIPYNSRIVFSGIYGIGKSYFLRRFFSLEEFKNRYEVLRLSPVNYSIASNEDIIRYIRYDLLVELIIKGINFEELNLQLPQYLALYLQKNWQKLGLNALKTIAKISKVKIGNYEVFGQLIDFFSKSPSYKAMVSELKSKYDESNAISTFLDAVENDAHLYDETIITKLIERKIQLLKVTPGNTSRELILIIDDLDRIDPEHIFRILNVFGAHFENTPFETVDPIVKNKFGFDKVILVCDINNIRNIFHSKYGTEVDFTGYIDKFYTHEIFNFDIRALIVSVVYKVVSKFNVNDRELTRKLTEDEDQALYHFIKALFKRNLINLRSFLKFHQNAEQIHFRTITDDMYEINPINNTLLWQLVLVKQIFGDRDAFKRSMEKLELSVIVDEKFDIEKVFSQMLFTASIRQHRFKTKKQIIFELDNNTSFRFTLENEGLPYGRVSNLKYYKGEYPGNDDPFLEEINYSKHFMPLLNKLIAELIDMNII